MLFRHEPELIYGAGDRVLSNGRPESIGFRRKASQFGFLDTVFGVSGGAALYRREVFEKVGLFDDLFVAYFEDVAPRCVSVKLLFAALLFVA